MALPTTINKNKKQISFMRLVKRFLPIFLMMGSGSLIERTVKYDGGTLEVYDSKIKTNFELNLNPKPHIK